MFNKIENICSTVFTKFDAVICVPAQSSQTQSRLLLTCFEAAYKLAVETFLHENTKKFAPPKYTENMVLFAPEPECGA